MKGVYKFYQDGKLVGVRENLLTNAGHTAILRYLAGQIPNLGDTIAIGSSPVAASSSDVRLSFEIDRFAVQLKNADITNDLIIFKTTIPQELVYKIYEIGLWTTQTNRLAGQFPSKMLTSFDTVVETWTNSSLDSTNQRVGDNGLRVDAGISSTVSTRTDVNIDMSGYTASDTFLLAFYKPNNNISTIKLVFANLAGGSFSQSVTVSSLPTGYNVISFPKSGFTPSGTISWGTIERFGFDITAGGTAGFVTLDALRAEDTDTLNNEYALISRAVYGSPILKTSTSQMDVEYGLEIS